MKRFTIKEEIFYIIRQTCLFLDYPLQKIGNWATDKLNKSYYNIK